MKETNMEHFRSKIETLISEYPHGPYCIHEGKLEVCSEPCGGCCEISTCTPSKIIKWLMSPYKPEPVLTQREKHFVEFVQTRYIARDEDRRLDWYEQKPLKDTNSWYLDGGEHVKLRALCANDYFPFITWEDEEPWAVEELRKLKVQE